MSHALRDYQSRGFEKVEGWVCEPLFAVTELLCASNISQGGGVCEIGIHHGKFFLLLNQVTDARDRSFAIDLFDDQSLNVDKSGAGSLEIFKRHLETYDVHQGRNTTIIQADSTDSRAIGEIIQQIGRGSIRFFSIDGGHTVRHTINDLQLANVLMRNDGVVFLDDILSPHWLGVLEGAFKYLLQEPTLVPFAIGLNKMLLCKHSFYDRYFQLFRDSPFATKIVPFLGGHIVAL